MEHVSLRLESDGVAVVSIESGKVNALNESVIEELSKVFTTLAASQEVRVVVLTGRDKFFTFGFDIPHFFEYPRENFTSFLIRFTDFYHELFMFPKPVIAAINGHCVAAGTTLACACDYRLMVAGRNKIGINELGFGSTVFAGTVEMLKYVVGARNARKILYMGDLLSASDALSLGLVDKLSTSLDLARDCSEITRSFASKAPAAFGSLKTMLRRSIHESMLKWESHSIHKFVDIWYAEDTRARLGEIRIHE